jgi:hypothetical protein
LIEDMMMCKVDLIYRYVERWTLEYNALSHSRQ